MDDRWVSEVVQAIPVKDLCSSLEPGGLLELDAGILLEELRGQAAKGSKHGL